MYYSRSCRFATVVPGYFPCVHKSRGCRQCRRVMPRKLVYACTNETRKGSEIVSASGNCSGSSPCASKADVSREVVNCILYYYPAKLCFLCALFETIICMLFVFSMLRGFLNIRNFCPFVFRRSPLFAAFARI